MPVKEPLELCLEVEVLARWRICRRRAKFDGEVEIAGRSIEIVAENRSEYAQAFHAESIAQQLQGRTEGSEQPIDRKGSRTMS